MQLAIRNTLNRVRRQSQQRQFTTWSIEERFRGSKGLEQAGGDAGPNSGRHVQSNPVFHNGEQRAVKFDFQNQPIAPGTIVRREEISLQEMSVKREVPAKFLSKDGER